jgi:hypothetical protein
MWHLLFCNVGFGIIWLACDNGGEVNMIFIPLLILLLMAKFTAKTLRIRLLLVIAGVMLIPVIAVMQNEYKGLKAARQRAIARQQQ